MGIGDDERIGLEEEVEDVEIGNVRCVVEFFFFRGGMLRCFSSKNPLFFLSIFSIYNRDWLV